MSEKVSVICLCFNHALYVKQSIQSVLDQEYENVELIIADDASTDGSQAIISKICQQHPKIKFIQNPENIGNCKTFNKALAHATGTYVIDLAADDLLDPKRIGSGVKALTLKGNSYGIHYSDAWLINADNQLEGLHSQSSRSIKRNPFPEGDLFSEILRRYFICPPTVMVRKSVFDQLGGYDEDLSYEDFDFYVRSSRVFKFCVSAKPLVVKRLLDHSKSSLQNGESSYFNSTLTVCKKARNLLKTEQEKKALITRITYECREALKRRQTDVVNSYVRMMKELDVNPIERALYSFINRFR